MQTILDFILQNWIFLSILLGSLLAIVSLYFVFNLKPSDRSRNIVVPKETLPTEPAEPQSKPVVVEPVLPIVRDGEIISHPVTETPVEETPASIPTEPAAAEQPLVAPDAVASQAQAPKPKKSLGRYHVMYRSSDNSWIVKREGSERILRVLETQKDAIAFANIKALTNETQIVIHKKDGKIRKQNYRKGDED